MAMPGVWQHITESYEVQQVLKDQRAAAGTQPDLPWTSTSFLIGANAFYLIFTFILYTVMRSKTQPLRCKAFRSILLLYNFICVLLAGYVVGGICYVLFKWQFSFVCNTTVVPGNKDDPGYASLMAHFFWVFYAQKFWEFFDTWFFILRKSFRQVTFLHVFHHCSINIVVGIILPYEFSGDMYLPILLNAVVHVLMYSHYLVSALGLSTPWKPWLTSLQLTQFVLIATQSILGLQRGDGCGAPYFAKAFMVVYMLSMLLLFGNFFLNAYVLKKPTKFGGGVVKGQDPLQVTRTLNGRAVLDSKGSAMVELPTSWAEAEIHYQVTPIGRPMPNLHIGREPSPGCCSFELSGGTPDQAVSWTTTRIVTLLGEAPRHHRRVFDCCGNDLHPVENSQDPQGLCCSSPHIDKKSR